MLIETELTPNPATIKFLPGREVMGAGTRDFASPEEAEASPLANALFRQGDVTGVFFGSDFKGDQEEEEALFRQIRSIV